MWKWSDLKRIFMRKASTRDTADLGAVMWPVIYPKMTNPGYQPRDPHITVVIFDDINNDNLGFTMEDVISAVKETHLWNTMLWATVDGIEWFGENRDVPVLRVSHSHLITFRERLLEVLAARGIPIDMRFPDYKPHVTITDEAALDGVYPQNVMAGPVEVWWGNEHHSIDGNYNISRREDG